MTNGRVTAVNTAATRKAMMYGSRCSNPVIRVLYIAFPLYNIKT